MSDYDQMAQWRKRLDAPATEEELAVAKSFWAFQRARYKSAEISGFATSNPAFVAAYRAGTEECQRLRKELEFYGCIRNHGVNVGGTDERRADKTGSPVSLDQGARARAAVEPKL